ncbi:MAG: NAD+ synthase [Demequinaceae bacterium]|nr:NAD+ synthase [Demequinaceae bacterium]
MPSLRLALAQVNPCVGDLEGNAAIILGACRDAAAMGVQVVVLPEMVVTGYPIEDLALRESFQRAARRTVSGIAQDLADEGLGDLTVILGTLGTNPDGRPTNEAVVIRDGKVLASYAKHHLPNYGVFDERRIFAPGETTCVIEVGESTVGIVICEDIWQDGGPVGLMDDNEVRLLVVLNGSPFEEGKGHLRRELAARRAREVGAPVAYVNLWGGQDDLVFDGQSFVIAADGTLLATAPAFTDALLAWELPASDDEAPHKTQLVTPLEDDAEVYWACVTGLRDYVRKNEMSRVTLGLSGGIDSALTAMMAADALGAENVVGVSMPSRHSSDHSKDDAAALAANLGIEYRTVEIEPMVLAFEEALGLTGVAAENIQARVRGMILMGISNSEGPLVLATGNKSELATGYSTVYGDAVGGFAPLKDVDKSRVWDLARWRNGYAESHGEHPPIPANSIDKPPSAELRPNQTDQDNLPPYNLLDEVLDAYVEHAEGRAELIARGFDPAVVDKVLSLTDRAEWKRRQYPPGPKVTALAFGRDRRLPITSRWREKVEP